MIRVDGFERAGKRTNDRIVMSVTGRPGCGKTHFALTWPGPIGVQNLDIGLRSVVDKFVDQKDIVVSTYSIPITLNEISKTISRKANDSDRHALNLNVDGCIEAWEQFKKDFFNLLKHPDIRTIVWDTATEVWQLIRAARFGKLDMVEGHMYGPVNMELNYLLKIALNDYDKNLVVLHKMKKTYKDRILASGKKDSYWTGEYERDGFSNMDHLVELVSYIRFDKASKEFVLSIDSGGDSNKSRLNPDLIGMEFAGDMCNYDTLHDFVFP